MAEVYLARKKGMQGFTKPVAMKVILPQHASNKNFIKMFLDEARLCVYLNHSNIAQVMDLGEINGQYFIAMEFAHGMDLQQISRKTRKSGRLLPLPYAAKIISQIAEGLYYAHTKVDDNGKPMGIVHRDISPHNIILTFDGQPKLIDFGIAKATVTYREEDDKVLKGKFSYMSPEQIRGMPIDPRTDIFALGIVLWEICTGASLYRESSELLTMEAILHKPVPKPRELRGDMPADLEAIILKALAGKTKDRFHTAFEMHQALEGYLNRSGWNVGAPHLSEFMKKLFPEEYQDIRDLLKSEREKAQQEDGSSGQEFVAWEPYETEEIQESISSESKHTHDRDDAMVSISPANIPSHLPPSPVQSSQNSSKKNWGMIAIVILLSLLVLVGAAILLMLWNDRPTHDTTRVATQVTKGSLHLDSKPQGADVFINGKHRGTTPLDTGDLPLDEELTIKFTKKGYEIYYLPVKLTSVKPNISTTVELQEQ